MFNRKEILQELKVYVEIAHIAKALARENEPLPCDIDFLIIFVEKRIDAINEDSNTEMDFNEQAKFIEKHINKVIMFLSDNRYDLISGIQQRFYLKILARDNEACLVILKLIKMLYPDSVNRIISRILPTTISVKKEKTLLDVAIQNNQLDIARELITSGADATQSLKNAFSTRDLKMIEWLCDCGVNINVNESNFSLSKSYLDRAIANNDLEMIQLLVNKGAKININRNGLLIGATNKFTSKITNALDQNKLEIVQILFDRIKLSDQLKDHLYIYLLHAPLSALRLFIEDESLSTEQKMKTELTTHIMLNDLVKTKLSYEILLEILLWGNQTREASPQEKLELLEQIILQLLQLDLTNPFQKKLQKESCYANLSLFEETIKTEKEGPKKGLAKDLCQSISLASSTHAIGTFAAILYKIASYQPKGEAYKTFRKSLFQPGITLIITIYRALNTFKEQTGEWPEAIWIRELINKKTKKMIQNIFSEPGSHVDGDKKKISTNPAATRFLALAGSSAFGEINITATGGGPEEAATWYIESLNPVFQALQENNLLQEQWNEEEIRSLLTQLSSKTSYTLFDEKTSFAIGLDINVPGHYIPAVLFRENNHWVYRVMCRAGFKSAVDFQIPDDKINQFIKLLSDLDSSIYKSSENLEIAWRSINTYLFFHFDAIEKLTAIPGTYAGTLALKPYQYGTCYASNFKYFLAFLLEKMIVNDDVSALNNFNTKMKKLIEAEMSKQGVCINEKEIIPQKESPIKVAYKLITCLLRWKEINLFAPQSPSEAAGLSATISHVTTLTKIRSGLFFNLSLNDANRESNANEKIPTRKYK